MSNPNEYVDLNWCPDCGERSDLCTCAPELPFAGYVDLNDDDPSWYETQQDRTCPVCNGTGGDRWNDGITPCPECDGEGYLYWLP